VTASAAVVELARPVGRFHRALRRARSDRERQGLELALDVAEERWLLAIERSCRLVVLAVEVLAEVERRGSRR
jgi:hypothetical protein